MRENASAIPYNGGNYSYFVNFTTKSIAILAATLTCLDAVTTVTNPVNSPLISGHRLSGECRRIPCWRGRPTVPRLPLNSFYPYNVLRNMSPWNPGLKSSLSSYPLVPHSHNVCHCNFGNGSLGPNGKHDTPRKLVRRTTRLRLCYSPTNFLRRGLRISREHWYHYPILYLNSFSLSLMEGFELTPSYVEQLKPGVFPKILRNLWLASLVQESAMMLLVWAIVPYQSIHGNLSNIVSVLAEEAAQAKWLRYWLVCDAVLVLCAGTKIPPSSRNKKERE